MNRLKKILLSFALPFFCLLISVSYAIEINVNYPAVNVSSNNNNLPGYIQTNLDSIGSYTLTEAQSILSDYLLNNNSSDFNSLINSIFSTYGEDKYVIYSYYRDTKGYYYGRLYTWNSLTTDIGKFSNTLGLVAGSDFHYVGFTYGASNGLSFYNISYTNTNLNYVYACENFATYVDSLSFFESNNNVKEMTYTSAGNNYYYWDGTSYYYEAPTTPDDPDTPSLPSNAEIAQVVQAFYDSDLYKNNTNFKDFMVVYNFITGYYSIIGTDNHLLQEIYYDGAKPSNDDFTYPDTWWRFYNYFGNAQNLFYGWDYWLYSTYKENDVFTPISYDGVGKINDLFKLKFTNQSIIVYSSYEYKVYEFRPPTEEGGENQVTDTTVPGDEYTYNENLDPTDSNYSPIQNYIPTNPSQSILGDVDFDEINKTFEENKDILNIEGASWLFTANNKFVGYFIGFLSLLIVFLIISRILGG